MSDVVNEVEEDTGASEAPDAEKKKGRGGSAGSFTATLIAIIAIGGVIFLYQQQLFLKRDVQTLQQALSKLLGVVEKNNSDILEQIKTVPQHNHPQLSNRLQQTEQLLTDTRMRIGQDRHAWALAEAEHLVRVADHDLRFKHNIVTAIAALQTARERLEAEDRQTFSDPIRRIDSDINALSRVQLPDREALAGELAGLVGNIDAMPLLRQNVMAEPQENPGGETATETQRSGWDKLWFDLGNLITIRQEEEVVAKPMLPPEQNYFLRRNLQLKLESARLALLLDNSAAWQASLAEAAEWTRRYFDSSDQSVKETLAAVERLASTKLLPPLPDLSTTRDLLQKLSRSAAGATTAAEPPAKPEKKTSAPKPAANKPATAKATPAAEKPVRKVTEDAATSDTTSNDLPTTPATSTEGGQ